MRRFLVCFGLVLLASGSGSGAGTEEEDSFLDLSDLDAVVGTDGDVVVFDGVALEDDLGMDEDQSFTYSRPRDSMDLYEGRDIEYDQAVNRPMNLALGVVYAIITVVGLIANCIVFFVIFAGRETSKCLSVDEFFCMFAAVDNNPNCASGINRQDLLKQTCHDDKTFKLNFS